MNKKRKSQKIKINRLSNSNQQKNSMQQNKRRCKNKKLKLNKKKKANKVIAVKEQESSMNSIINR